MSQEVAASPALIEARANGRRSAILALVAVALGAGSILLFAAVPKTAPDALQTGVTVLFLAALVVVPFMHFVGLVLGLKALFGGSDRRAPAAIGTALNGLFVLAMAVFIYAFFGTMGSFH